MPLPLGEGDREAVERVLGCDSKAKRKHFHSIKLFEFKLVATEVLLFMRQIAPLYPLRLAGARHLYLKDKATAWALKRLASAFPKGERLL